MLISHISALMLPEMLNLMVVLREESEVELGDGWHEFEEKCHYNMPRLRCGSFTSLSHFRLLTVLARLASFFRSLDV
jgi:hypothetical protein